MAELFGITTRGNGQLAADAGDAGLKLREKGVGNLLARVVGVRSTNNINDQDGILFREDAGGGMDVKLTASKANDNANDGVRFQGTGVAVLRNVQATGNGDDQIDADAGVTLTQIPRTKASRTIGGSGAQPGPPFTRTVASVGFTSLPTIWYAWAALW